MRAILFLQLFMVCAQAASYEARIRRTTYGIPHIEAKDMGSLGFGEGYAQAEDHLCSIADQVVKARGERARYFGAGPSNQHLHNDIAMKALALLDDAARDLAAEPKEMRDWYEGFAAGYNQYLAATGRANVSGWCKGADWVVPLQAAGIAAYHRMFSLTVTQIAAMIATAQPPSQTSAATASLPREGEADLEWPGFDLGASNGWAIGRDRAASGRGMLVANPHYPWVGSNRFWEKHLRIPGKLDVYGVSLIGVPGVAIGFNRNVAWTHTVSAGKRMTFYSIDLVAGQPTLYRYGSETKRMTSRKVEISVRQPDGSQKQETHAVWFSHYGPILNFPGLGWTPSRVLSVRDANWDNRGRTRQYVPMMQARNMKELQQAHADYQSLTWVNTIAASDEGIAWYADTAATPKLSVAALEEWRKRRENDGLTRRLWQQGGNVLLHGSDPMFEWQADDAARRPGVVPYRDMPKLERTDYVFNANDSFWMANSSALLDGPYSPLHGEQRTARSLRTRNNDLTLSGKSPDHPAGNDGKFTLDEMAAALLSNRSLAAELLLPELLRRCKGQESVVIDGAAFDLGPACRALQGFDGRNDLASRGAVLFREFMARYQPEDLVRKGKLWAVDFDPAQPTATPHTLASGGLALENLARAAKLLASRNLALDVPLGEVQYAAKAERRIPIHGGDGAYDGLMNMQRNSRNTTTLEPMDNPPAVAGSRFLTEKGYPVVHGSSFLMALEFTAQGPRAKAFLTYSQSGDPASPHFTDQTELFSRKQWRPVLFRDAEIRKNLLRSYTVTSKAATGR
ncbi:MAG: penicillin acylase family protein [Bryobacterales bacterium]|nr:penicillin acylase family protein [Bryobacterales bacterium]